MTDEEKNLSPDEQSSKSTQETEAPKPPKPAWMESATEVFDEDIMKQIQSVVRKHPEKPLKPKPKSGVLRLDLIDAKESIHIDITKEISIGRPDPQTGATPDIDFTTLAGYRMGVSRRHAKFLWRNEQEQIELMDLGSGNGTFINGKKLSSNRPYIITNGDEIRFGSLSVYVYFELPNPDKYVSEAI